METPDGRSVPVPGACLTDPTFNVVPTHHIRRSGPGRGAGTERCVRMPVKVWGRSDVMRDWPRRRLLMVGDGWVLTIPHGLDQVVNGRWLPPASARHESAGVGHHGYI